MRSFFVVPIEKASLASEDPATPRQGLFGEEYWILCVEKTEGKADIDYIKKHGVLVLPRYEGLPHL